MLELYQLEECPHCTKVRQRLSEWEIDYITRNVPKDIAKRTQLMKVSGQTTVPALVDSEREVTVAGNEQEIIDYLEKFHKPQPKADQPTDTRESTNHQTSTSSKGYG